MQGAAEQFVDVDDEVFSPYNDVMQQSGPVVPVYWCCSCNIQVVSRAGGVIACPECQDENILSLSTLGLPLARANGLRYRGRHRVASESDLSRFSDDMLGEGSNMPTGQNQLRPRNFLFRPAARIPLFGTSSYDWDDFSNDRSSLSNDGHEQDGRLGYLSSIEVSNSPFFSSPWGSHRSIHTRSPEPSWQQFMQEMLQTFLRGGNRAIASQALDHVSDPGDYMDDSRGFDRLLSELAENDNENHGPPPAAKSAVSKLPFIAIKQQHIDDDSATCPVCKDRMDLGEMAKELPCQHVYHESCILPWLNFRNSCPVCRFELPTDDTDYEARKHAATSNQRSTIGQGRDGAVDTGLRVVSAQEQADDGLRFYPSLGVEEIEEEFEAHPVQQSRRHEGWRHGCLWFAARPLLSLVGIVLAFTFGHQLIAAQEPIGNQLATAQLSSNSTPNTVEDDYNYP
ncbi:hypothetical protein L7F22_002907 [Adiantum nelumboides]|nr:hypothetical protein [Adiantum nelumboides]